MFSHNKFFITLIACTIANPCFAAGNSGTGRTTFPFLILGSCNCPENYYVSKCGDMDLDLDLGTINALVRGKHSIKGNTCWNDSYTDMHYLLHLNGNEYVDYKKPDGDDDDISDSILFYDSKTSWFPAQDCGHPRTELTKLRKYIYDACVNSCTCQQCPNDGQTVYETNVTTTTNGDKFFENFNTIADCYIVSGSDDKGTFTLQNPSDRCYYSYSE